MPLLEETVARIRPLDAEASDDARARQAQLTKPAGSLGVLEELSAQLCGIAGTTPAPAPRRGAVVVFAGDHGVLEQGVSPWPAEVTRSMIENFRAGGAAVSVLARAHDLRVVVVDVGVATPVEADETVWDRNVRRGTADLSRGPAMSLAEARAAVEAGIAVAAELVAAGHDTLLTGDMGIGNTTPAAALVAALTGARAEVVTGRGTGVDDATLRLKTQVVADAVARTGAGRAEVPDPIAVLAEVGGLEHAAIAGLVLGGAAAGVPVVLDGYIAGSAALVAAAIAPRVTDYLIAGHRSAEYGHGAALERLGLRALVDLDLRLGEGTGAVAAYPLVRAAALILEQMATFDSAGIARKQA